MLGSKHARLTALLAGGLLVLVPACAGPGKPAVTSAAAAAIAVEEASNFAAPLYTERADECWEDSASWPEYDQCLAGWNVLIRMDCEDGECKQAGAIVAAEAAVLALEESLASWEELSGEEKLAGVLSARDAVVRLLEALEAVGVDEPFLLDLRRYLVDITALLEDL